MLEVVERIEELRWIFDPDAYIGSKEDMSGKRGVVLSSSSSEESSREIVAAVKGGVDS